MVKKTIGVLAFIVAVSPAWSTVTYTGYNSNGLNAQVDFDLVGSQLQVTLSNISTADVLVPANVLTGVFFDYGAGTLTLTPVSGVLNAGSVVVNGTTDPGNVVGGEWAYKGGLSGAPHGAKYGISSSGLGLFGPGDLFPGSNLDGPTSPDGLQYGITSLGDNIATGNAEVLGSPLIKNSVVFLLSGLPTNFVLTNDSFKNVSFQYGTALDEPNLTTGYNPTGEPGVPGPAAALSFGIGFWAAIRRRKN